MNDLIDIANGLEASPALERPRLVGLCARLTSRSDIAEDLAQETVLEAWRHLNNLRDQQKCPQWLSGIAHNVCLRWQQEQAKEARRAAPASHSLDAPEESAEQIADEFDLEIHLDREELIELLDRALAVLPGETRSVLIERYVLASPLADVAATWACPPARPPCVCSGGGWRCATCWRHDSSRSLPRTIWAALMPLTPLAGRKRASGVPGRAASPQGFYDVAGGELWLTCPACCPASDDFLIHTDRRHF